MIIREKRYLDTSNKYYIVDVGLRYAVLGTRNIDYGHIYENIVALEILNHGYEVYIGKLYDKESILLRKKVVSCFMFK